MSRTPYTTRWNHPPSGPKRTRPPASFGLYSAIGAAALIGLAYVALTVAHPKGAQTATSPNAATAHVQPCQANNSPRINLNTKLRIEVCTQGKAYAKAQVLAKFGTDGDKQFGCLDKLWTNESAWSPWAINTDSGAYGIAQILPSVQGHPSGTNIGNDSDLRVAENQIDWGLNYISRRADYGSPCKAWSLWQSRSPHWY